MTSWNNIMTSLCVFFHNVIWHRAGGGRAWELWDGRVTTFISCHSGTVISNIPRRDWWPRYQASRSSCEGPEECHPQKKLKIPCDILVFCGFLLWFILYYYFYYYYYYSILLLLLLLLLFYTTTKSEELMCIFKRFNISWHCSINGSTQDGALLFKFVDSPEHSRTHIANPCTVGLTHVCGDWLHCNLVMHVCMSFVSSTLLTSRRSDSICCPIRFVLPIHYH